LGSKTTQQSSGEGVASALIFTGRGKNGHGEKSGRGGLKATINIERRKPKIKRVSSDRPARDGEGEMERSPKEKYARGIGKQCDRKGKCPYLPLTEEGKASRRRNVRK